MVETAVPQGFKQTEVGVIPEDWEVKKLRDCLLQKPDYGINAAAIPYNESLPVYLRITDITDDGKYSKKNIVSVDNVASDAFYLQKGDLVFARTGASVGKTYLYDTNDGELVFAGFLIRIKTHPEILIPEYLQFYTQTSLYWQWIRTNSLRTGQPGINGNEYGDLPVSLPPKAEQTAIATALSDTDALIAGLEKLLAKKRAIKQAAMQELLRPKEGWEMKKLGAVLEKVVGGGTPSRSNSDYWGNEIPWVTIKDYATFNPAYTQEYITKEGLRNSASHLIPKGTLLLSTRMAVGKVIVYDVDVSINQDIKALFLKKEVDSIFLFYWFQNNEESIGSLGSGSTVMGISLTDLKSIALSLPPKPIQVNIARTLTDMDTEIEALEKKLSKYQMLKQGMMQTLLTGKVRLV